MVEPEPLDSELALASHWVVIPEPNAVECKVCNSLYSGGGDEGPPCPNCGGDPDRVPKRRGYEEQPKLWEVWGRRFLILLFIFAAIMVFIKESSSSP